MIAIAFLLISVGMFGISLYFAISTFPIRLRCLSELRELTEDHTTSQPLNVFNSELPQAIYTYFAKGPSNYDLPQEQFAVSLHSFRQSEFTSKPILPFDKYAREYMAESLDKNKISSHHDRIVSSISQKLWNREEIASEYKVRERDSRSSESSKMRTTVHQERAEPAEVSQSMALTS